MDAADLLSRLANRLFRLGVENGDRVSILAHNSLVYILYGLAKLGATEAELIAFMEQRLARYKVPKSVVFMS